MQKFGGDWTEEKLDCVSSYLAAYATALKNQGFRKRYIDAFAGTGYRELADIDDGMLSLMPEIIGDEPVRFLEGSAVRALQVEPRFDEYLFIEKHRGKFAELEGLRPKYPGHHIQMIRGDANGYLQSEIPRMDWKSWRGVMFLDPFGAEVTWDTLQTIADTGAIDLWYLFPLLAVIRMLPRSGSVPDSWRTRLSLLLGADDWYDVFYRVESTPTLFGPDEILCRDADVAAITSYIVERLKQVFPAVADNPLLLCNSGGRPLFLLCFAASTRNEKGQALALRIAGHILGKKVRRG